MKEKIRLFLSKEVKYVIWVQGISVSFSIKELLYHLLSAKRFSQKHFNQRYLI
jgi:hypothetical protein